MEEINKVCEKHGVSMSSPGSHSLSVSTCSSIPEALRTPSFRIFMAVPLRRRY